MLGLEWVDVFGVVEQPTENLRAAGFCERNNMVFAGRLIV